MPSVVDRPDRDQWRNPWPQGFANGYSYADLQTGLDLFHTEKYKHRPRNTVRTEYTKFIFAVECLG